MQLPNAEQAEITDHKLLTYLLDHAHPQNKDKAAFYAIAGYDNANTEQLKAALLKLILASDVAKVIDPIWQAVCRGRLAGLPQWKVLFVADGVVYQQR